MKRKKYFIFIVAVVLAAGFIVFAHAQMVGVGVTLPSVPTGVVATAVLPFQVSVSWNAASESSGTIEGYYVYRNGGQIAMTADRSFVDSGITSGIYIYTVAARDANGNISAQSSPASATLIADTTPPTPPTGVTIAGTTSTNSSFAQVTLTISWGASTDNVGVAGYYIYRNGTRIASSTSAFTGTSVTDTVTPGTYTYTVVAYDASQNFSNRSAPATVTIGVDTTPPSTPMNVSAQQVSATGVNLSWATSTDNVGIAGYQVYRNGVRIANVGGTSYADTGLSLNIAYTYTVTASDIAGNVSGPSAPATVTVQLTNGPIAPYALSAALLGTSEVELSWAPARGVLMITGYAIYRDGAQIASVTSTDYLDKGLAVGIYTYGVSATDISGAVSQISPSTSIIVTTPAPGSAPVSVVVTTPIVASSSSVISSNAISEASPIPTSASGKIFTQSLYFGLRNTQVEALQSLLVGYGYLTSANATGFFGAITLHALQKFQCDHNIVCTGDAGWGIVGPKTRNVLNDLQGGVLPSVSALNAEIQALQTELANLERQFQSVNQ